MAAVWDHGPDNPTQRFVLLALADYADHDGSCYPSYNKTAQRCAISRSTAMRAIKKLAKDGWLTIETQTRDNGSHTSNRIFLNLERLTGGSTAPLPSGTVTLGWYQDDTTLVADCDQGGSTVPPLDPLSDPLIDPSDDPKRGQRRTRGANPPPLPASPANSPPAVQMLHRLTSYWPGDDNADYLVKRLGDAPDEVALAAAVKLWRASGNKSNNWAGICDWYDELCRDPTWTPGKRFKTKSNGRDAGRETVSKPKPGSQPVSW